ncbi:MAG: hypothetical protein ACE5KD_00490 [Candidatus Bathyarchaeia archaeon]
MEIDQKDMDKYFYTLKVGECFDMKTKGKMDNGEVVVFAGNICRIDENTIKGKFIGPDKTEFEMEFKKRRM